MNPRGSYPPDISTGRVGEIVQIEMEMLRSATAAIDESLLGRIVVIDGRTYRIERREPELTTSGFSYFGRLVK